MSKNSKDIYTINNIKNAVMELGGYNSQSTKSEKVSSAFRENKQLEDDIKKRAHLFFSELKYNIFIEKCLQNRDNTPEVRNSSVITSGTGIIVASRVAGYIFSLSLEEGQTRTAFRDLFSLDWSRKSILFQGSIIGSEDKILNSRNAINSATNLIMVELGYLQKEDQQETLPLKEAITSNQ